MKRSLLFLLLMLVSYIISPTLVNGQKNDGAQTTSQTMKKFWNGNQHFKRFAKPKTLMEMKIASQLAKKPAKVSVPDKKAYAYMLPTMEPTIGLSEFNMSNPKEVIIKYPGIFGEEPHISGGAYANGKYYCFFVEIGMGTQPLSFGYIDIETGDITDIASFASQPIFLSDMTYDYSTQTMYTLGSDIDGNFLATIDLQNGQVRKIAILNEWYWTLAATYDGVLYAISAKGELVILNKQTGRPSVIGSTGIIPTVYQSMDFDHTDETLYWAATEADTYNGYFCVVDVHTGKATVIDHLGDDDEMVALYIPFELPKDDAPAAVSDFKVIRGENGVQSATLSWTNPDKTVTKQPLSELTKVEIYRDGILVHTISPVNKGQALTWKDTEVSAGNHVYRIIPYNSAGKGFAASTVIYIGHDVPAAVSDIMVTKVDASTAKLTWKAPTEGVYGGWIDASTLKYKITRYPDEKLITEGETATEYTDNSITELKRYSYLIQAFNADGEGDKAISAEIVIGAALDLPYSCTFQDELETSTWTIIDNDKDGFTWGFNSGMAGMLVGTSKTGAEIFGYGGQTVSDDWLLSPELKLQKGKAYKLEFSMLSDEVFVYKMKVTLGKGATVEAQTIDLGTFEISNPKGKTYTMSLPDNLESGNYNVGFHIVFDNPFAVIQINSMKVEEDVTGHVIGKVTDIQTGNGVKNAIITLNRNGKSVSASLSDTNGDYKIQWVKAGDYELSIDKKGYEVVEKNITIQALKTITENASLKALPEYTLSGTIMDAAGSPMEGVEVEISGYDYFKVMTDANGKFNIPAVYRSSDYYIAAFKSMYLPYFSKFVLTENKDLGNINMQINAIPPTNAIAQSTEETATLSWNAPVENTTFRYDSGSPAQRSGLNDGTEYSIMGSVYRTPTLLRSMSWIAGNDNVNIYIMDLDEEGRPTSKVLYSAKNIDNTDSEWTSYTFSHPVEAPNGFMVAISYDKGSVGIACAENTDEYPFRENVNYYSMDYRFNSYILSENDDLENNFMIRAEGVPMYKPVNKVVINKAAPAISTSYTIYRVKAGDEANKESWKKVASEVTGTSYTDKTWAQAERGVYRYAVASVYNNQLESTPIFTGEILKDMNTEVSIHVDFLDKVLPVSALVMFENLEKPELSNMVDLDGNWDGKLTLVRGLYKISIFSMDESFSLALRKVIDRVDLTKEESYSLTYSVYPVGPTPFNVRIEESTDNSCTISWNKKFAIFDDFESHKDFEINSPGQIGWTYIDRDETETVKIEGLEFPNAGSKMAYIVMNPQKVELSDEGREYLVAYSGTKYLADVMSPFGNDDYIISPELNFNKEFVLSFYAKSYVATYGLEEMKIGYSTTGNKKEDFVWLTEKAVNVPLEWTNYTYIIPAEAKYVTINCVSYERFIFMLDDIFIGSKDELNSKKYDYTGLVYTIYLDDKKVGETQNTTYTFTNLSEGKHVLGVQSNFENGASEIITVDYQDKTDISSLKGGNEVIVYPNPVTDYLHIRSDYTSATVMSSTGAVLATQESGTFIDMSRFGRGIYLIKITHNNEISYHKVMVR